MAGAGNRDTWADKPWAGLWILVRIAVVVAVAAAAIYAIKLFIG